MKEKCLNFILNLFAFKVIKDEYDNEYVVFKNNPINYISDIKDKTQFEASENHIHLCDNVKKKQFNKLINIGNALGKALLYALKSNYPSKEFVVYVTVTLKDSMIIRFHQKWGNEYPYYDQTLYSSTEAILRFDTGDTNQGDTGDGSLC